MKKSKIDVAKVVADYGGPTRASELMGMSVQGVCNMVARGNIRMQTWLTLRDNCEAGGARVPDLEDYLVEG